MNCMKIAIAFLIFVSTLCLAHNKSTDSVVTQIVTHGAFCVKSYGEEKIYLQEQAIFPMEGGIFVLLSSEGDHIQLPLLLSDDSGCYIPANYERCVNDLEILNRCPWCKQPYFVKCRNPDCPGKPKRKD